MLLVLDALLVILCEVIFGADVIKKFLYLFSIIPIITACLLVYWRPLAPVMVMVDVGDKKDDKEEKLSKTVDVLVWIGLGMLAALLVMIGRLIWFKN